MREKDLYKPVIKWLKEYLKGKFKKAEIYVFDTHNQYLAEIIKRKKLTSYFPLYATYQLKVDIAGIILKNNISNLAIVECKTKPIALKDFAQILGYAKILNPILAIILSPYELSPPLFSLLSLYEREDILEYSSERKIIVATWDTLTNSVSLNKTFPLGYLSSFNPTF
jgi:hypothetical protein